MMYKGYQYTKGPFTDSPQYKIDEIIVKKEDLGEIYFESIQNFR